MKLQLSLSPVFVVNALDWLEHKRYLDLIQTIDNAESWEPMPVEVISVSGPLEIGD